MSNVGSIIADLEANGGTLRFICESSENDWCSCWLLTPDGESRRLGAESFEAIAWRLGSRLTNERPQSSGEIDGHDAYCAFSLADGHSTLYYYRTNDALVFVWQDSNAHYFDVRILLPRHQCRDWQRKLASALQQHYS